MSSIAMQGKTKSRNNIAVNYKFEACLHRIYLIPNIKFVAYLGGVCYGSIKCNGKGNDKEE